MEGENNMNSSLLRTNEEFSEIYSRNFNNVYQICYMILKNSHDAEDITQNVFLKLYNSNTKFNDLNHEKGWLLLTAKNMSINSLKHWKTRMVNLFSIKEVSVDDKKDETLKLILKLKTKYKLIIYMYYYMGYKTDEIAILLNKNESTIRSDLLRGRKQLKIILEENK